MNKTPHCIAPVKSLNYTLHTLLITFKEHETKLLNPLLFSTNAVCCICFEGDFLLTDLPWRGVNHLAFREVQRLRIDKHYSSVKVSRRPYNG